MNRTTQPESYDSQQADGFQPRNAESYHSQQANGFPPTKNKKKRGAPKHASMHISKKKHSVNPPVIQLAYDASSDSRESGEESSVHKYASDSNTESDVSQPFIYNLIIILLRIFFYQ